MPSLKSFNQEIARRGVRKAEGNTAMNPGSTELLQRLVRREGVARVMEIGFNAGHSANTLLAANPGVSLTSFDLGRHGYEEKAKSAIDALYPGRHSLVLGDSRATVPAHEPERPYDMIFIDGGHRKDIPAADLENCRRLAHADTIVLMDDIVLKEAWKKKYTNAPTKAWTEMRAAGRLIEEGHSDFRSGYGMSWGRYGQLE
eukprot:jgi/Tetstr1/454214/TSEL_041133.t1